MEVEAFFRPPLPTNTESTFGRFTEMILEGGRGVVKANENDRVVGSPTEVAFYEIDTNPSSIG